MTKLLPAGFGDLINIEARINQEVSSKLLTKFQNFGYDLVKTPLLEFEQTLKNYQKLNEQSFHIPDISSGKNLIFRNDITIQIARLVSTRLKDQTLPLRLCYLGDILKVVSTDLHSHRQITQAGIELIGNNSVKAVEEVLEVSLKALEFVEVKDLTIEFCLPKFLDLLLEELQIKDPELLKKAIEEKNVSKIKELGQEFGQVLINLVLEIKNFTQIQKELGKLPIPAELKNKLTDLDKIIKEVTKKFPEMTILVNIFSDLEFLYHEDVGFTVFAKKSFYPILRGGKYEINEELPAVGATIYVNHLRKILLAEKREEPLRILLPSGIEDSQIEELQQKNYITVRSLSDKQDPESLKNEAENLNCHSIYLENKITKI